MKKIIVLVSLFLLSCNSKETTPIPETTVPEATDSVIIKSQQSVKNLDSITNETTEKVTSNVEKLTQLVETYKTQTQVKVKVVKEVKQVVIHDTIYIEKKKNFWGREKTTTRAISDSSVVETADSTINE